MTMDLEKFAVLSKGAREEYFNGYEKAYKNIPDLCDGIDEMLDEMKAGRAWLDRWYSQEEWPTGVDEAREAYRKIVEGET